MDRIPRDGQYPPYLRSIGDQSTGQRLFVSSLNSVGTAGCHLFGHASPHPGKIVIFAIDFFGRFLVSFARYLGGGFQQ